MLRRRLAQAGVAIGVLAASLLGFSPAANAAPTSFVAKAVHAGGAGALGVQATGGLAWYSRSVTLTSVRFYANAGECGYLAAEGWQGSTFIDFSYHPPADEDYYCGGATGRWFTVGNIALDGSQVSGGITQVRVYVLDASHDGQGYAYCNKASSACTSGQF
ncbi:hypothetical protein GCM10022225_44990 [Plantactinospora mayteni]|uniref:Secreted protein n=1 Tax=Plantactinospora mayteni TaxID=566021 RepID=A0ABQ4EXM8_9ACTN|nr:hypothetical protein [Plantactinospora mayteni]GIG99423.1 hypothetical protein Pma05_59960 [Plantactinospora mayteni]